MALRRRKAVPGKTDGGRVLTTGGVGGHIPVKRSHTILNTRGLIEESFSLWAGDFEIGVTRFVIRYRHMIQRSEQDAAQVNALAGAVDRFIRR